VKVKRKKKKEKEIIMFSQLAFAFSFAVDLPERHDSLSEERRQGRHARDGVERRPATGTVA